MLLGLDAVIYEVPDLARAKEWYSETFDIEPYSDGPVSRSAALDGHVIVHDPRDVGDERG